MPYVERYPDGSIKTICENPQPGYAEEFVEHAALPEPPRGDALPLILTVMAARLDALEAGRLAPEEDEGQPAAIFTEEDVEAINDSAVAETGGVEGDGAGDDGVDLREVGDDAPAYPGIAILPDELGARRNAVLAAITTEKLTRLSIAMDPSRADFLAARFAEYQNAGALGLAIDDALAADSRAFQELRDRRDRITNYAMQLEQSALDGDMDRLSAMHAGLGDGWP